MKVLITNDDGITSTGILAASNAIEKIVDTTIVAPVTQQSGIGHTITLFEPIRLTEQLLNNGKKGYGVSGTPADCVIMGVKEVLKQEPDFLVSGINIGENMGKGSITTSGTIGAALEAATFNIPSIAISLQVKQEKLKFQGGPNNLDFTFAEEILEKVLKTVIKKGMPDGADILNINVPADPDFKKIKPTKLAKGMYTAEVVERIDPNGRKYYWITGDTINNEEEGTDVHTVRVNNQPSITPIKIDTTLEKDITKWIE
jgi:5'-nucleotidase